jgi:DNA-directed RNA polymerase specialized sigma24 family protein
LSSCLLALERAKRAAEFEIGLALEVSFGSAFRYSAVLAGTNMVDDAAVTQAWLAFVGGNAFALTSDIVETINAKAIRHFNNRLFWGRDISAAADAVQEAWMHVLVRPECFDLSRGGSFQNYFNGVAFNKGRDALREPEHKDGPLPDNSPAPLTNSVVDVLVTAEFEEKVARCWYSQLTFLERWLIMTRLHGYDELIPERLEDWTPDRVEQLLDLIWPGAEGRANRQRAADGTQWTPSMKKKIWDAKRRFLTCLVSNPERGADAGPIGEEERS